MTNHLKTTRWIVAAAIVALSVPASAQDRTEHRVDARTVAARVQSFYGQTDTFQSSFYQTYYNAVYQRYERSRGTLAFDKPGRMRFDYARPNGKVIASDGRHMTIWEPGDDQGPGQYAKQTVRDSDLPSAFSFLTGQGRLEDDYRFRIIPGRYFRNFDGDVLEMRPRRPDPRIRRILLFVDSDPARLGVVHQIRIDDHEGNRNKFELSSMRFNRHIPTGHFAFTPPQGARRMSI